jgi:hypothetical protein
LSKTGTVAGWLLVCACGPAVDDDGAARTCEYDAPLRVLAFDGDEQPTPSSLAVRFDDRVYFGIGRQLTDDPILGGYADERVTATDVCGGSRKTIAEGVKNVHLDDRWPDELLARDDDNGLVALDPSGHDAPITIAPGIGWVTHAADVGEVGVVTGDDDPFGTGALVLQPYPAQIGDTPPARVALLDNVAPYSDAFSIAGDEVFARDALSALVAVDLGDQSVDPIADGVVAFLAAQDGRSVVTVEDVNAEGFGTVIMTDRDTGTATTIDVDAALQPFSLHLGDTLVLDHDPATGLGQSVVLVPSLETWDVPPGITTKGQVPDGRWLADSQGALVLYDPPTQTVTPLYDRVGVPGAIDDEGLDLVDADGTTGAFYQFEGPLLHISFDGGDPQLLANRVGFTYRKLPDGGIITLVDVGDDRLGTLVTVDPDTLEEHVLDDHVYGFALDDGTVFGDGLVYYAVQDGDRSGIWVAPY